MRNSWTVRVQLVVILCGICASHILGFKNDVFESRRKLVENLTADSTTKRQILPVLNDAGHVEIEIGISLRQISTVDEVNQVIRLTTWLRIFWLNPFLAWDPKDHGNVTSLNIDNELIWIPDIAVYNKASLEEEIDILYKRLSTPVIVNYTGQCRWQAPATILSQCRMNVKNFPFDTQNCEVTFGSWTYALHEIDIRARDDHTNLNDFIPNGEWEVLEAPLVRGQNKYDGNISYPHVKLKLRIKRQPMYYTLNLIVPCTVISMLAFLSFLLPTNHGERVSLVITVLLAMSVYMLIVSSTLPQTSDAIPVIGTYFLCIIVLIALCLFATCFIASLRGNEHEMPKWMYVVVNKWMRRLFLMRSSISVYEEAVTAEPKIMFHNGDSEVVEITSDVLEELLAEKSAHLGAELKRKNEQLHSALTVLTNDVERRRKREIRLDKWRQVAEVFDRFFLLFFSLCFVILVSAMFG